MRILFLLFLFINLYIAAFCQVIKGTIYEEKTNDIICFATVYFNGTFVGTLSDQNGNFELNISNENRSMPLTVSCIGYHSVTITEFSATIPLIVYMQPQLYELKDVVISDKSLKMKRRRNLRLFKKEFIGTTANAKKCKILNENDITFNYDSDDDTLKAYALNPILIENMALGYKITYFLDKFEYYKKSQATFFCGNFIFNEDLIDDEAKTQFYKSKREQTYLGSRMHFFRVLWSGQLKSSGFIVRSPSYDSLNLDTIVFQDDKQNRFLGFSSNILIEYNNCESTIEFIDKFVYFDESGLFSPGIKWSGEMARQRIADWLPYEYSLEQ